MPKSCRSLRQRHNGKLGVPAHFFKPPLRHILLLFCCESQQGVFRGLIMSVWATAATWQPQGQNKTTNNIIYQEFNARVGSLLESVFDISTAHPVSASLPPTPLFLKQCLLDVYLHGNPNTKEGKGKWQEGLLCKSCPAAVGHNGCVKQIQHKMASVLQTTQCGVLLSCEMLWVWSHRLGERLKKVLLTLQREPDVLLNLSSTEKELYIWPGKTSDKLLSFKPAHVIDYNRGCVIHHFQEELIIRGGELQKLNWYK